MKKIGEPLDWDINSKDYEYNGQITDKQKDDMKRGVYRLACEYIYRRSQELFKENM